MNTSSVSRLALALAFGVTLTACSSTPPDQIPSDQTAPGTSSRPILSANEAQNFVAKNYFSSLTPNTAPWTPSSISLPAQPDFGRPGRYARRYPHHHSGGGGCGDHYAHQQTSVHCDYAR